MVVISGVTKEGQRGQLPPGAADEGCKTASAKIFLTTVKVSLMKFAE